ncbi:cysteine synthase family protein [Nocardia sp. CDC159]|uniref:Cysteine synthase family protein n=1 Tax=Nocardia pulmonis TaxID=2951408 RepID=A0A9X2J2F5_9NOCA|nr:MULTISPECIES: cysteine synthase family protein [Nocardia]MCM6777986.1 cysteine synthase family protein [Nocardia pulmonis]MCM6790843.1 cysteine synthase family protein [Nocardia sp. CDC159]
MKYDNIIDVIGGTPLVRLNRLTRDSDAAVWVKLECLNPSGSVKVRPALAMVREALRRGQLTPTGTIVEATSGNLGIALAMIGAALGIDTKIMVDPRTPPFSVRSIAAYGARPTLVEASDEHGKYQIPRIRAAEAIVRETPGAYMPNQWNNPDNPAAHSVTTAQEILTDLDGEVHAVVCTTSSCGQITGIGRALRQTGSRCLTVAVDGRGSTAIGGPMGQHLLIGLGSGFTPGNFDRDVIDHAYWCGDAEAFSTCRLLAAAEGLLLGGSSGAAVFIALRVAQLLGPGHNVVAVAPDGGDRYLETIYDDGWISAHEVALATTIDELRSRLADYEPYPGDRLEPWRHYPVGGTGVAGPVDSDGHTPTGAADARKALR